MMLPSEIHAAPLDEEALGDAMLAHFLVGSLEDNPDPTPKPWAPSSDGEVEWALSKLAECRDEIETAERNAEMWHAEVRDWLDDRRRPLQRREDFFTSVLTRYLADRRAADERVKSIKLPSGTIASKRTPPRPAVADEEAFFAWARNNAPRWLVVTERADLRAIAAEVGIKDDAVVQPSTGEVIPGLEVVPESISYQVRTT